MYMYTPRYQTMVQQEKGDNPLCPPIITIDHDIYDATRHGRSTVLLPSLPLQSCTHPICIYFVKLKIFKTLNLIQIFIHICARIQ